ncbi:hypothetical protein DFH09DRAFT_1074881 [Mycena vulgaris]|nr:hypothetical protein DFH09DRAFT_1074881 [Mycena vulgaris]
MSDTIDVVLSHLKFFIEKLDVQGEIYDMLKFMFAKRKYAKYFHGRIILKFGHAEPRALACGREDEKPRFSLWLPIMEEGQGSLKMKQSILITIFSPRWKPIEIHLPPHLVLSCPNRNGSKLEQPAWLKLFQAHQGIQFSWSKGTTLHLLGEYEFTQTGSHDVGLYRMLVDSTIGLYYLVPNPPLVVATRTVPLNYSEMFLKALNLTEDMANPRFVDGQGMWSMREFTFRSKNGHLSRGQHVFKDLQEAPIEFSYRTETNAKIVLNLLVPIGTHRKATETIHDVNNRWTASIIIPNFNSSKSTPLNVYHETTPFFTTSERLNLELKQQGLVDSLALCTALMDSVIGIIYLLPNPKVERDSDPTKM